MTTTFDVVIIGAGPVGANVADRIVQGGLTAAIVERDLIGGECSYWACMPTKALLRDAAALRADRALPGASSAITGDTIGPAETFLDGTCYNVVAAIIESVTSRGDR